LSGVHQVAGVRFGVGVAVKVKQAVDDVEGGFAQEWGLSGCGFTGCGFHADEDFAVVERDHVCGGGILEKLAMDGGDGGIIQQGDFYFWQVWQHGGVVAGSGEDEGPCHIEQPLQNVEVTGLRQPVFTVVVKA
jgi:hypothetical protein